jgi:hypothetical protein
VVLIHIESTRPTEFAACLLRSDLAPELADGI